MSLFAKLFAKSPFQTFPENEQAQLAIKGALDSAKQISVYQEQALGQQYHDFCNKQPKEVSTVLQQIAQIEFKEKSNTDQFYRILNEMFNHLRNFRPAFDQHLQEMFALSKAREDHKKATEAEKASEAKYNSLNSQENANPEAVNKAKTNFDAAHSKRVQLESELETKEQNFSKETIDYQRKMFTTALETLSSICDIRIEVSHNSAEYGKSILELSQSIPSIEDSSLESLEQELKALEDEISQFQT